MVLLRRKGQSGLSNNLHPHVKRIVCGPPAREGQAGPGSLIGHRYFLVGCDHELLQSGRITRGWSSCHSLTMARRELEPSPFLERALTACPGLESRIWTSARGGLRS